MDKQPVYITNVRKGFGTRRNVVFAEVRDLETDELLISATLDHCLTEAYERYDVYKADH